VGATEAAVQLQFLGEAVMLTLFGGLSGVLLGSVGCAVFGRVLDWSVTVPFESLALGPIVAIAVGIGFGFYPARRAARLDPIEALRHE
jgi:putative ABC transport system permease protein